MIHINVLSLILISPIDILKQILQVQDKLELKINFLKAPTALRRFLDHDARKVLRKSEVYR